VNNLKNKSKPKTHYKKLIAIFLSIYLLLVLAGVVFYNSYPSPYEITIFILVAGYALFTVAKSSKR